MAKKPSQRSLDLLAIQRRLDLLEIQRRTDLLETCDWTVGYFRNGDPNRNVVWKPVPDTDTQDPTHEGWFVFIDYAGLTRADVFAYLGLDQDDIAGSSQFLIFYRQKDNNAHPNPLHTALVSSGTFTTPKPSSGEKTSAEIEQEEVFRVETTTKLLYDLHQPAADDLIFQLNLPPSDTVTAAIILARIVAHKPFVDAYNALDMKFGTPYLVPLAKSLVTSALRGALKPNDDPYDRTAYLTVESLAYFSWQDIRQCYLNNKGLQSTTAETDQPFAVLLFGLAAIVCGWLDVAGRLQTVLMLPGTSLPFNQLEEIILPSPFPQDPLTISTLDPLTIFYSIVRSTRQIISRIMRERPADAVLMFEMQNAIPWTISDMQRFLARFLDVIATVQAPTAPPQPPQVTNMEIPRPPPLPPPLPQQPQPGDVPSPMDVQRRTAAGSPGTARLTPPPIVTGSRDLPKNDGSVSKNRRNNTQKRHISNTDIELSDDVLFDSLSSEDPLDSLCLELRVLNTNVANTNDTNTINCSNMHAHSENSKWDGSMLQPLQSTKDGKWDSNLYVRQQLEDVQASRDFHNNNPGPSRPHRPPITDKTLAAEFASTTPDLPYAEGLAELLHTADDAEEIDASDDDAAVSRNSAEDAEHTSAGRENSANTTVPQVAKLVETLRLLRFLMSGSPLLLAAQTHVPILQSTRTTEMARLSTVGDLIPFDLMFLGCDPTRCTSELSLDMDEAPLIPERPLHGTTKDTKLQNRTLDETVDCISLASDDDALSVDNGNTNGNIMDSLSWRDTVQKMVGQGRTTLLQRFVDLTKDTHWIPRALSETAETAEWKSLTAIMDPSLLLQQPEVWMPSLGQYLRTVFTFKGSYVSRVNCLQSDAALMTDCHAGSVYKRLLKVVFSALGGEKRYHQTALSGLTNVVIANNVALDVVPVRATSPGAACCVTGCTSNLIQLIITQIYLTKGNDHGRDSIEVVLREQLLPVHISVALYLLGMYCLSVIVNKVAAMRRGTGLKDVREEDSSLIVSPEYVDGYARIVCAVFGVDFTM